MLNVPLHTSSRWIVRHPPRVVIVDDHPVWRQGLRLALQSQSWAGEIVEAGSAAAAMRLVAGDDIVAMDVYLPDGDGIAAAQDLMRRCPSARVIIVTMSVAAEDFDRAVKAGVHGYVAKTEEPDAMVEAFRTVMDGGSFLDFRPVALAALPPPFDALTGREREILARVVRGDKGERIARDLGISHQYVKNMLTKIYRKLGVDGRMGAVALMREKGIDKLG